MAQQISRLSEGRFDVSIAPAVALWNFTDDTAAIPEEETLKAAIAFTDYTKISIDGNNVTVPANMSIDLGAIAKGYIADMVADFLKDKGVQSALLNFGGNVVVIGQKPDGAPYNVGVQDPDKTRNSSLGVVQVRDLSVVTSGIYERGFDLNGVRYHHILDTDTGMPVQNDLASVTIITNRSHLADALSTACFALGYEKALTLLQQFEDTEAIFINRDRTIQRTEGLIGKFTLLANP
jgi:thiamine biosynthesis lipoprotein